MVWGLALVIAKLNRTGRTGGVSGLYSEAYAGSLENQSRHDNCNSEGRENGPPALAKPRQKLAQIVFVVL